MTGLVRRLVDTGMSPTKAAQFDDVDNATGWSTNGHLGADLAVPAATPTDYVVDGGFQLANQAPSDVSAFWAGNKITGRNGDAIVIKIQFKCLPDDAVATNLNLKVDIGGAVGVVEEHDFPLVRGALVDHPITFTFLAYTLDTWEANGGRVILEADGDVTIPAAGRRVLIARAHKAK